MPQLKPCFSDKGEVNNFDRLCKICITYQMKENEEVNKWSGTRLSAYREMSRTRWIWVYSVDPDETVLEEAVLQRSKSISIPFVALGV